MVVVVVKEEVSAYLTWSYLTILTAFSSRFETVFLLSQAVVAVGAAKVAAHRAEGARKAQEVALERVPLAAQHLVPNSLLEALPSAAPPPSLVAVGRHRLSNLGSFLVAR